MPLDLRSHSSHRGGRLLDAIRQVEDKLGQPVEFATERPQAAGSMHRSPRSASHATAPIDPAPELPVPTPAAAVELVKPPPMAEAVPATVASDRSQPPRFKLRLPVGRRSKNSPSRSWASFRNSFRRCLLARRSNRLAALFVLRRRWPELWPFVSQSGSCSSSRTCVPTFSISGRSTNPGPGWQKSSVEQNLLGPRHCCPR